MSGEVFIFKMIRLILYVDFVLVSRMDLRSGYFFYIVDLDVLLMVEKFELLFFFMICCVVVIDRQELFIMEGLIFDDDLLQCFMMKVEGLKVYIGVLIYMNDLVVGVVEVIC